MHVLIAMRLPAATLLLLTLIAAPAAARQGSDEIARKLSNPISDLTSVPFQFNYDHGVGADRDSERLRMNLQPVVPISIGDGWNLISRTIVPVIEHHGAAPGGDVNGVGDTLQSLFFSPKAPSPGGWIWGVGPVFLLPTASDARLGGDRWGAGPTVVALRQTDRGWTYGGLANHVVSLGGGRGRDVSTTFLQPFLARRIGPGRTISANLESTYDWKACEWTVPVNLGISQVVPMRRQIFSLQGGVTGYVQAPKGAPDWGLRLTLTLLYPRR